MRFEPLHFHVAQRGGRKNASRQLEHLGERLLVFQFVDGRAAYHALDRDAWPDRRHLHRVPVFESQQVRFHAVQKEVVHVHGLNQLAPAIVIQNAQRSAGRRSARNEERVQRSGEGTDVIRARLGHIADFVDANGTQPRKRHVGRNIPELRAQNFLQVLLNRRERLAADENRSDLRQADAALPVDHTIKALRNASPQIDGQAVAGSHNVVRAGGQVHRKTLRIPNSILEYLCTEPPRLFRMRHRLDVYVV